MRTPGRGLCYADAAVLLGGRRSKLITTLNHLTGGALLAASGAGSGFALSLFDAKSELFKLSTDLLDKLPGKLRGVTRFTRTERLSAAHSVIVIAAFFEALREEMRPYNLDEAELTPGEQVTLATGEYAGQDLVAALVRSPIPLPTPELPYEDSVEVLAYFYYQLGRTVQRFLSGLTLRNPRPAIDPTNHAVELYEELFHRLATDFPEFAFWANLVDHQATRAKIRRLHTSLAGLEAGLSTMSTGRPPDALRNDLAKAYQAALRRPALTTGQPLGDLRVPLIKDSYVNPDFRVAGTPTAEAIADKNWWADHPRRTDLQEFLIGHFTTLGATEAPLVVLGQPGSGKSLLTEVLAARLPANDFLTVRVPLREVPADADPQTQIEQAIRAATGESQTWPQLVRSAGDALPVVLFDGFDELLQATGLSQSNYLEKLANFQQREADQDRPVAVVVTTRMSVADRARPVEGTVAVLLEPFDDSQIEHWLKVWHSTNESVLADRGMRPLPLEDALAHHDLAKQPLLLLMLALYDADANALQRHGDALGEADLYERLLTGFARREVLKSAARLPDAELDRAVDKELLQLSIVAFAMFNRQQLWVTETQLQADLSALLGDQTPGAGELTPAQVVVGRFYFVHVAQAVQDEKRLKTFEFLHATFGEYLVARLVIQELADLAGGFDAAPRTRPRMIEDYFLHALLSFVPLTMRRSVVDFVAALMAGSPEALRDRMREVLLQLFHVALEPRRTTSLDDYLPGRTTSPARCAAYSANLCLLVAMAAERITSGALFPGSADNSDDWTKMAHLWQSQLPAEGWWNLTYAIEASREWEGEQRTVGLRFGWHNSSGPTDPRWTYDIRRDRGSSRIRYVWRTRNHEQIRTEADFLCGIYEDTLLHNLEPLLRYLGPGITTFHDLEWRSPMSPVRALIELWLTSTEGNDRRALTEAFDRCMEIALYGFASSDHEARRHFRILVLRQIAADRNRLPEIWLGALPTKIREAPDNERQERRELIIMAKEILQLDI